MRSPPPQAANDSARLPTAAASVDAKASAAAAPSWTDAKAYRPDPFEMLARAGYRWSWKDDLAEFVADVRANPTLAIACTVAGVIAGMLAVVVPAVAVALFQ